MSAELMDALQIPKFSVKKSRGVNFMEGLSHSENLRHLETMIADERHVPEDTSSFTDSLVQWTPLYLPYLGDIITQLQVSR